MFKPLVLILLSATFLPTAAAEPGSSSRQTKAKPVIARPVIVQPVIVQPILPTAVGKPTFGFHGSLARVTRPAPRIVLPTSPLPGGGPGGGPDHTSAFVGFGGGLSKPHCRVLLSRPAPALARKTLQKLTDDAPADDAPTEVVVSEVFYPLETAPRMPVDGYNPVNPSNAPFKKTYRVCYSPNDGSRSTCNRGDSCCNSCDTCDSCDSCCPPRVTSCEPCYRPRVVRRVYYRPVVYARPCGWGGGWGGGWGRGWRGGWGGGFGWRGGWGWGGGFGPYW